MNDNIVTTGCALLYIRAHITNFLTLISGSSLDDPLSVYLNDGRLHFLTWVVSASFKCETCVGTADHSGHCAACKLCILD